MHVQYSSPCQRAPLASGSNESTDGVQAILTHNYSLQFSEFEIWDRQAGLKHFFFFKYYRSCSDNYKWLLFKITETPFFE